MRIMHRSRGSPPNFQKHYQVIYTDHIMQIHVLSSSIKKGEIERAFPSHYVLMLDDNPYVSLTRSLSVSGYYYMNNSGTISETEVPKRDNYSGSTAEREAVVPPKRQYRSDRTAVPLRRYHCGTSTARSFQVN